MIEELKEELCFNKKSTSYENENLQNRKGNSPAVRWLGLMPSLLRAQFNPWSGN